MSPAVANFVFEAVNFVLLAAALGWVLFQPVRRALDREQARRAEEEAASKRLRAEAEALAAQARAAREAADREAAESARRVLAAAQEEAARLLEDARRARAEARHRSEQELEALRAADAAALAQLVARMAAESLMRLLDALRGPSLDLALVRGACAELTALPIDARRSALVEVAHPLDGEAMRLLQDALGGGFQARTVADLGAGVRVTTSGGQVDATALAVARRAAGAVSAAGAGLDRPSREP